MQLWRWGSCLTMTLRSSENTFFLACLFLPLATKSSRRPNTWSCCPLTSPRRRRAVASFCHGSQARQMVVSCLTSVSAVCFFNARVWTSVKKIVYFEHNRTKAWELSSQLCSFNVYTMLWNPLFVSRVLLLQSFDIPQKFLAALLLSHQDKCSAIRKLCSYKAKSLV